MKIKLSHILKILATIALLAWFAALLAKKIDLTTADLGRHIQNGAIIVHGSWADKWAVLHTNFYSYTLPNQPFVNHHWLSGVVFYFIHQAFGFAGLSVFYMLLGVLALALFFWAAVRQGNFWVAFFVALLLLPLMASRVEARPEIFTYFFSGVFYFILSEWRAGRLRHKWLMVFLPLMLFWVNLHIGFIFGFLILGAFGLEQMIKFFRRKPNGFMILLFFSVLTGIFALANPFGYRAVLYPLDIFKNYGYLIVENQSVGFLENLGFGAGRNFLLFKIASAACLVMAAATAVKNRRNFDFPGAVLILASGVMAYFGIRHFPSFAFFALPFLSGALLSLIPFGRIAKHPAYCLALFMAGAATAFIIVLPQFNVLQASGSRFGIGLLPDSNKSAEFFVRNGLKGPVFNDYDIGGYLIYNLFDLSAVSRTLTQGGEGEINKEKAFVFTDNRPEAYTADFFENFYREPQQNEAKWAELDKKYDFNVIFFSHRDYTPWAQQFLIARIQDSGWAPVFADAYNIIFLKKKAENARFIQKYYISPDKFRIIAQ